ncbi:MAG: DUF3597 domain-containing protein [Treponema sp.]|nr:DUF3597 domain-containing protein [Treponema sp.]
MGVFDSIKEKLFGKKTAEPAKAEVIQPNYSAPSGTAAAAIAAGKASAAKAEETAKTAAAAKAAEPVDIEAVMEAKVKAKGIKLNWRESIVDLLKALDLDSSLAARKELAAELKYSGPHADGSAEKNIWLHKEVMKALAANGGKVPKELLK